MALLIYLYIMESIVPAFLLLPTFLFFWSSVIFTGIFILFLIIGFFWSKGKGSRARTSYYKFVRLLIKIIISLIISLNVFILLFNIWLSIKNAGYSYLLISTLTVTLPLFFISLIITIFLTAVDKFFVKKMKRQIKLE
jgi:hypothetical protein